MGLKKFAKGDMKVTSPGPRGRHIPKNGMANSKYAKDHGITTRQASKQRRGEKWN